MTINRRELIGGAGALAAAAALPGGADAQTRGGQPGDAAARRMLGEVAERLLAEYPENATSLGLDKGARAGLKARLTDRTPAGDRARAGTAAARLARLKATDRRTLGADVALNVDVVQAAHELAADGYRFPFGDVAVLNTEWSYRSSPYAAAHNMGAWAEYPDFLDTKHVVATRADAEAFVRRLDAYADNLDGETERLRRDAALGVVAPAFLIDKQLRQMRGARATPITDAGPMKAVRRHAALFGNRRESVEGIVTQRVNPALDRQIAELTRLRARATADAGVWHVRDGDAYYAWALRAGTTTRRTPDEVHRIGLEELAALQSRMDGLLRARGLTRGTVGERMTALGKDPANLYPNTDAGRAEILRYIEGRVADMRGRLPRAFATLVPGRLVVKRVPPEIELGAPGGYAAAGAIDGSTPGNYYINLRDTAIWPRYALPTLTYHEGIAGHIWQGEYTYKLPLVRSLLAFNAYSEGWALYAEQLADELGAYEGDPLGQLGYLQSLAFRACRLVVDTGLHAKRWSRDRAVRWFAETNGSTVTQVEGEVDRYCAWPGQACGYKVGHSEMVRLRARAQAVLGPRYDGRRFNDALVLGGAVPMTLLERVIDAHVAERRG